MFFFVYEKSVYEYLLEKIYLYVCNLHNVLKQKCSADKNAATIVFFYLHRNQQEL